MVVVLEYTSVVAAGAVVQLEYREIVVEYKVVAVVVLEHRAVAVVELEHKVYEHKVLEYNSVMAAIDSVAEENLGGQLAALQEKTQLKHWWVILFLLHQTLGMNKTLYFFHS